MKKWISALQIFTVFIIMTACGNSQITVSDNSLVSENDIKEDTESLSDNNTVSDNDLVQEESVSENDAEETKVSFEFTTIADNGTEKVVADDMLIYRENGKIYLYNTADETKEELFSDDGEGIISYNAGYLYLNSQYDEENGYSFYRVCITDNLFVKEAISDGQIVGIDDVTGCYCVCKTDADGNNKYEIWYGAQCQTRINPGTGEKLYFIAAKSGYIVFEGFTYAYNKLSDERVYSYNLLDVINQESDEESLVLLGVETPYDKSAMPVPDCIIIYDGQIYISETQYKASNGAYNGGRCLSAVLGTEDTLYVFSEYSKTVENSIALADNGAEEPVEVIEVITEETEE